MEKVCIEDSTSTASIDSFTYSDRPLLLANRSMDEKIDRQNFYEKKVSRGCMKDNRNGAAEIMEEHKPKSKKPTATEKPQEDINKKFQNKEQNATNTSVENFASVNGLAVLQDFATAHKEKAMSSRMADRGSSGRRWRKRKFSKEKAFDEKQKEES